MSAAEPSPDIRLLKHWTGKIQTDGGPANEYTGQQYAVEMTANMHVRGTVMQYAPELIRTVLPSEDWCRDEARKHRYPGSAPALILRRTVDLRPMGSRRGRIRDPRRLVLT